jgi:alkylation response protein AidB-like acyl-CoA dehydrogenase
MNFELDEEHRMLKDVVARFVREDLIPLENAVMARESSTGLHGLTDDEERKLDEKAQALGLWGLDAPAELGGSDLPVTAMVARARGARPHDHPTSCRPIRPTCAC